MLFVWPVKPYKTSKLEYVHILDWNFPWGIKEWVRLWGACMQQVRISCHGKETHHHRYVHFPMQSLTVTVCLSIQWNLTTSSGYNYWNYYRPNYWITKKTKCENRKLNSSRAVTRPAGQPHSQTTHAGSCASSRKPWPLPVTGQQSDRQYFNEL